MFLFYKLKEGYWWIICNMFEICLNCFWFYYYILFIINKLKEFWSKGEGEIGKVDCILNYGSEDYVLDRVILDDLILW